MAMKIQGVETVCNGLIPVPLIEEEGAAVIGSPPEPVTTGTPGDFVTLLLDELIIHPGETR